MLLSVSDLDIDLISPDAGKRICRNLNFSVSEGETLGILGESGSGKSITALSILGLLPPLMSVTSGKIFFTKKDGNVINITNSSYKALESIRGKEISMVFQEPMTSLNPVFTCGEQLLETILQHCALTTNIFNSQSDNNEIINESKNKVIQLFEKVRLKDPHKIYSSYPFQLSGGQRQRVMIGMAVSCNPRLLIADEPTTALDLSVQESILGLIRELKEETGMSIIFITHNIKVITEIAERVLIIKNGEIVEQGDIASVISNPVNAYTKGLMACSGSLRNKGERLITLDTFNNPVLQNSSRKVPAEIIKKSPILTINNLSVSFKNSGGLLKKKNSKMILKNIDLEIYTNETLGLVGESGSGKTTLVRTIMKLLECDSGIINFHGSPINNLNRRSLKYFHRKVQIIFQDPYSSLNPRFTIGDMITEPMVVHRLFKKHSALKNRAMELLQQVQLDESFYSRYPHQLSGGQRQRIGIARALAVEPELLILDESVSALDVSIQAQVLNLLNDLKNIYKLTYIFISHDLDVVRYMSDRVVELKNGTITDYG